MKKSEILVSVILLSIHIVLLVFQPVSQSIKTFVNRH
jgi:hypothetical protein